MNKAVSKTGNNPRQLHHIIYDDYECGIGTAIACARLFRVSVYSVLHALGYEMPPVQVVGEAGSDGLIVPGSSTKAIPAPTSATPTTLCVIVRPSGAPGGYEMHAFFEPKRFKPDIGAKLISAHAVVHLMPDAAGHTREYIGTILEASERRIKLLPPGTAKAIVLNEPAYISPVVSYRVPAIQLD